MRVLPDKYEVEFEHRRLTPEDVIHGRQQYARGVYDYQTWLGRISRLSLPAKIMKEEGMQVSPNGGMTMCFVKVKDVPEDQDDNLRLVTFAVCSVHDNFNRKKGRDISLGRALKQLERDGEL